MCEFAVLKKGKVVFEDAVYAKSDRGQVTVRDVLGVSETFKNCMIEEVDVRSEQLVLVSAKK
ncbi:MAG: CooT family nickel-binding protein [Candidatus Bathyarchaeota archaeon]|jgi:predicted RNA-binding protein